MSNFNSVPLPLPQNIFRFEDRETFIYPGNIQIGTVSLYQFLATMTTDFAVGENVSGARFLKGQVIGRGPAATGFILANNASLSTQAIGLCGETADPGFGAAVQLSGPFCLFDWTAITGTVSLLPRTTYYLDSVSGKMTSILPVGPAIMQRMGYSLSPNVLNLNLDFVSTGTSGSGAPSVAPAWFFSNCC